MKRSEMVINLAIEMMGRLPEWKREEREAFASELLQVCEIEGMLPPPSTDFLTKNNTNYVESVLDAVDGDFKWDDEDEND